MCKNLKEYETKTNYIAGKYVQLQNIYRLTIEDLKKIIKDLSNEEIINDILKMYDDEFLIFKDCGLPIFENLYVIYKKYVLEILKKSFKRYIRNKYPKEKITSNEYVCYISSKRNDRYMDNPSRKPKIYCK